MSSVYSALNKKWATVNQQQQFLIKVFVSVVLWKLLYAFVLGPSRIPDAALTNLVASGTAKMMNVLYPTLAKVTCVDYVKANAIMLFRDNRMVLMIADRCNGLELMLMYAGMVLLLPYPIARKLKYIAIGLVGLVLTNMIRCVGLEWIYKYYQPLFETTHHYLFTLIMYVMIFLGWVLYVRKPSNYAKG